MRFWFPWLCNEAVDRGALTREAERDSVLVGSESGGSLGELLKLRI